MSGSSTKDTPGPDQSRRIDWLDALRGWAVAGVLMVHSMGVAHSSGVAEKIGAAGQYGVQLFFVVSALTISMTYDSHVRRYGRSLHSQFAWLTKRYFRIAPLYSLAAIFYPAEKYAMYVLSHHEYGWTFSVRDICANLLFVHTWVPSANNSVVPGGWSIGVEMFFYLLVPFIWLIASIRLRIGVLLLSAALFLLTTLVVNKACTGSFYVVNNSYLYYWFPTQAPTIFIGLLFYFLNGDRLSKPVGRGAAYACFAAFVLLTAAALYAGAEGGIAPFLAPAILGVAFVLLILSLQGWMRKVVANPVAAYLGRISFSMYILHFVVLDVVLYVIFKWHIHRSPEWTLIPVFLITLVLTSLLALASKKVIEDPGIAFGHRLSKTMVAPG
jgi:peptidoglycan/LPS O-acetylase OafA/YrhL